MKLSQFITQSSQRIISEWEIFARSCLPAANAMDLEQRRDHVAGMLKTIALDLETAQTKGEQHEKSVGKDDAHVDSATAANAHGTDRAASGYTPVQMVSEFRALRASILRLWADAQSEFNRANLDEITRFNEAIDQLLVESIARYAQDVDRTQDLFLGVLGHDLRNPLGAIMMSATVMMTNEGPDWRQAHTAARILRSGTRINLLIGDLLDFTRARLGAGIPIVPEEVDLEVTCRNAVDELVAYHPDRAVTFEASGRLHGRWDSARIAQALSNLLGNAHQHGSSETPIEVAVRGEADQVVLTVHNKGLMIPERHLQNIFDPFRQLAPNQPASNRGSAGLGLFIVQAIATAHGGEVDVESTERGTTFTMRLPRNYAEASISRDGQPAPVCPGAS